MKTVSHSFEGTNQNVAMTVLLTMPILGGVPYPYLLRYLSDAYGVHLTYLIGGGLLGSTIPMTLLWHMPKQRQKPIKIDRDMQNSCSDNDIQKPSIEHPDSSDA